MFITSTVNRLRDDIKLQSEELVAAQANLRDSQGIISECQSQLLPAQYEVTRYQREKHLLEEKVNLLETELNRKIAEASDDRKNYSNIRGELESKIVDFKAEIEMKDNFIKSNQASLSL